MTRKEIWGDRYRGREDVGEMERESDRQTHRCIEKQGEIERKR